MDSLDKRKLPKHVAIIMDGNGRWAKSKGMPRLWGHKKGINAVRRVIETSVNLKIENLTLYAFSDENWGRSQEEVSGLMELINSYLQKELTKLNENNIRLRVVGNIDRLPEKTKSAIQSAKKKLEANTGLVLSVALSYGSRNEISSACRSIAEQVLNGKLDLEAITADTVSKHLWTNGVPDPDLLIRTSGEQRLSNFLLWQMAYTELWFTDTFWPEFNKEHFIEALSFFQNRQRRFGKV